MRETVIVKSYNAPNFNVEDVLKYVGCTDNNSIMTQLANECVKYLENKLIYKVCYLNSGVTVDGNVCDFDFFSVSSESLSKHLNGCNNVIIFAATIGLEIDRIIARYKSISPSKALMLQAVGTERVEALCDAFAADMQSELDMPLKSRFSPGYGDLPLDVQKNIFNVFNCHKNIGAALCDSLLITPTKTVTAFVGY